ncbi:protein UsfY [Mycolicibacterium llatzerense]|uniref:protein UsfY n=1 Tax=Mycolicibacterium llatzerense TaxID=280871 RepID=UPI0021B57AB7|nr:protein UsfY [Mycolicibacterium llatzerense]
MNVNRRQISSDEEPKTTQEVVVANYRDPTDHFRTTLPHTGERFIDIYSWPGVISIVLGALALIGGVAAAAYQQSDWVPTAGIVGICAIVGGIAWLVLEHRRVVSIENRWHAEHPDDNTSA